MSRALHSTSRPPGLRPAHPEPAHGVLAIGRGTMLAAGAAFVLLAAWASGATWFLVYRDDIAARFIAGQTRQQYAYEARLSALRARLDRVATQKLLEQDGLEGRVAELAGRQMQIENRQAVLSSLAERTDAPLPAGGSRHRADRPASAAARLPEGVSAFAEEPRTGEAPPFPSADALGLRIREPAPAGTRPDAGPNLRDQRRSSLPLPDQVGRLERAVNGVAAAQAATIRAVLRRSERRVSDLRAAFAAVGVDLNRPDAKGGNPGGLGGPLVPFAAAPAGPAAPDGVDADLERLQVAVAQLDRLRRVASALPLSRPAPREAELTSGFGYRLDPFTRGPALHTGLDFRLEYGAAVRAAGAGKVIAAEPSGGYGNMVEIDHGGGITTRYAHLSTITVAPGQTVGVGTLVGRVGSTGRSTGAHLHYETRIDGEPVDPQRFLRAGARLGEGVSYSEPGRP